MAIKSENQQDLSSKRRFRSQIAKVLKDSLILSNLIPVSINLLMKRIVIRIMLKLRIIIRVRLSNRILIENKEERREQLKRNEYKSPKTCRKRK